jgi:hypothetical protein
MAEDIFKYAPISEWNGMVVDFGMPSTDGDIRLTEICLAADACLEAASNAMALSFTNPAFKKARSVSVQKIVRTLFGEETGVKIKTFSLVTEDGAIHYMSPMVFADMQIYSKNWAYEIVNNYMNIGLTPILFSQNLPPVFVGNHQSPIRVYTRRRTEALNPLTDGSIIIGNRPVTGNWDTDGEPYVEINWETISTGRCTDNVTTNLTACEQVVLGGVCREQQPGRGYCSDSTYRNNESGCLNANETWSSSVGTPPLAMKMNSGLCSNSIYDGQYQNCINQGNEWTEEGWVEANIYVSGDAYCLYYSGSYPNGRCFYQTTNTNTQGWTAWGGGSTTESTCKDYATNQYKWAYWMWIPPGNVYTNQYAVWRPSYDITHTHSGWVQPHEIPGTVDSWKHFNIKTANNNKKYPINHVPSQTGANLRIYHSDTNSSWGNGTEVGRSTIPTWVTNTFDWDDNEHAYDSCHDPSNNLLTQWDTPALCAAAGTCWEMNTTSPVYPNSTEYTNFVNDEPGCIAQATGCYEGPIDTNNFNWNTEALCMAAGWCMGQSAYDNDHQGCINWEHCGCDTSWTEQQCNDAGNGNCYYNGNWGYFQYPCPNNNYLHDPNGCANHNATQYAAGNGIYHYCNWNDWNCPWLTAWFMWAQNDWHTQNHWQTDANTWSAEIPTIEVEMDISADYRWDLMFPPHTFVDTSDSRPLDEYGYTTSYSGAYTHLQSQIRWKPPQRTVVDYSRTYSRPTKFRIYRAPAWYQGLTTDTDYTNQIWKLAGEVITRNDDGYHYFYDTREDMFNEGLREFEQAYYGITAVWEDWNWKLGYTINLYDNMSGPGTGGGCEKWDIHHAQGWSAVVGNVMYSGICSNTNYVTQATCEGNGACIGNSDYNNNATLCLSFGTCSDPTYNNDETGCIGAVGTWTTLYVWNSANYTWTTGQWTGTANSSASLDNIENASPMGGYPQLKSAVKYDNLSDHKTYRASGYLRAPVTGTYYFQVRGDDGVYMWLGSPGWSVSTLVGARTWYNYLAAVPGLHAERYNYYPDSAITLTEGLVYPILAYGGNHTGDFAFDVRIYYPSGDWNDNQIGEWKYVPIDIMPEDMDPVTAGDGQTVEGQLSSIPVPGWYTNYP